MRNEKAIENQVTAPAHTPTPWKAVDWIIKDEKGVPIVHVHHPRTNEESDANAAFIVRAVNAHDEMFMALRLLTEADDVDLPSRLKGPMDMARKAIAKASK